MKKICRKLLPIFLQNIFYKTLFTIIFIRNTYEFYNFVEKGIFLQIFFDKFEKKSHII